MVWLAEPTPFTTEELAAIVKRETGGELHPALLGEAVWLDDEQRAAENRQIEETLKVYGQRPRDVNDPELGEIAYLLSTPPDARYGHVSITNGYPTSVYAARNRWFGVCAASDVGGPMLSAFRGMHVTSVILASIQDYVWNCGETGLRIKQSTWHAEAERVQGITQAPRAIQRARELFSAGTYFRCEFFAEWQPPGEPRRRSEEPLRVYGFGNAEYDLGTWTMQVINRGNERYVDLTPVNLEQLADQVQQLRVDLDDV